jgi:hypothetical protein
MNKQMEFHPRKKEAETNERAEERMERRVEQKLRRRERCPRDQEKRESLKGRERGEEERSGEGGEEEGVKSTGGGESRSIRETRRWQCAKCYLGCYLEISDTGTETLA